MIPFETRSIMVQGLPMGVYDLKECQALEYTLIQVFGEVVAVEDCSVVHGQGYAFIRVSIILLMGFIMVFTYEIGFYYCLYML